MKKLIFLFCLLTSGCSTFLFYPQTEHVITLQQIGLPAEDVILETPDKVRLHAWFMPAYDPNTQKKLKPKGTILFLHGNAENISTHTVGVLGLVFEGYNLFALDYRGFGASEGSPSLSGAETDIQTALRFVAKNYPGNIYVLGQSIGAALTLSAVDKSPDKDKVSAVIIDSSFFSVRQIAREKIASFWLLWPFQYPLSWIVAENNPDEHARKLTVPKLFLTTREDPVVPAEHTEKLYETAVDPKQILIVPSGGHIRALADPNTRLFVLDYLEQNAALVTQ